MARSLGLTRFSVAYLCLSAVATLASATLFYSSLHLQTGGMWSAPLDDVFIHFDYARATARGAPFAWSPGDGFSSGNTSLTYPFALAVGYWAWAGFRGLHLMMWAAILAGVSVLGFLRVLPRFFRGLPAAATLLAPIAVLSVGALGWSLWSGMEVACFLGLWALAAVLAHDLVEGRLPPRAGGWALGAAGVLVVMTRPEGLTSVVILAAFVLLAKRGAGLRMTARMLAPPIVALMAQSIANRLLTGESASNGALVKLSLYNPYLSAGEKVTEYLSLLRYCFMRVHHHHFGDEAPWGVLPLVLALVGLLDRRVRARAAILVASAVGWTGLVALNGQVRWQNERYLMPAVAWELVAAAVGAGALLFPSPMAWGRRTRQLTAAVVLAGAGFGFWQGERLQYQDQVWFFGRASRNIRDQHILAGRRLRSLQPLPHRVMVGDAGAIPYASDLPGFDLIGLGGYRGLPLARAGVHGLAATLELVERLTPSERPDVLAIYPDWWGPLPDWFGHRLFGVTVPGNVICGGAEKVVYAADWSSLGTGVRPYTRPENEPILDEVDVADLLSERAHDYRFPSPHGGYTVMKLLPLPGGRRRSLLWDGGRIIPEGRRETMRLHRLPTGRSIRLVFRTTAERPTTVELEAGSYRTSLAMEASDRWIETAVDVPAEAVRPELELRITPRGGDWVHYHLWAVAGVEGAVGETLP